MGRIVFAGFMLFVSGLSAVAQTNNATVGGTVRDNSSALIPGVSLTATNTQTGAITTVVSNETGAYDFAALQPGLYKITAELPGFQTYTYDQVNLGINQQVRMNFTLQVGGVAQAVEVTVSADTLIATTSASVGSVLADQKVRDLPLIGRNVMDLLLTTPGARTTTDGVTQGSFAGGRVTSVNVTRDGVNVQDGRYRESGAYSATFVSPDLIEEVRVIVAPVDAETGRGSGQVQMMTRSGTNQYRGSVFWLNRNSLFDSNTWFGNRNGTGKNYQNRNQLGARLGGPIVKNKTFFFALVEGQRYQIKENVIGNVLTAQARQGIFRYFPGVQNANAAANVPTADDFGNPVRPAAATGPLQAVSVFGRDPLRPGYDPSGWVKTVLSKMPQPNYFRNGDGLNTAGIQWLRSTSGLNNTNGTGQDGNRNNYNFRIDHNLNSNHKIFFSGSVEHNWSHTATAGLPNWPDGFFGLVDTNPRVYTGSLVSTLSTSIVNELRVGYRKSNFAGFASFDRPDSVGDEARKYIPVSNGVPFVPKPVLFPENFITNPNFGSTRGAVSPLWTYADTLSWTRGTHALKFGGEVRFSSSNGFTRMDLEPRAFFGAGGNPIQGIDAGSTIFPGLAAADQTTARNLLIDLSGSIDNVQSGFVLKPGPNPTFVDFSDPDGKKKPGNYHQNEWSSFFKDDWKIHPNLTLNLGARYEFYGSPYEANGLMGGVVGGTDALKNWTPATPITAQLIGKNSPHPEELVHRNNWNNVAPAIGLSWSLPWFGKDKTVIRAGYGINYHGGAAFAQIDGTSADLPGMSLYPDPIMTTYTNPGTLVLPVAKTEPFRPILLTDRSQDIYPMDSNYKTPYIQNYNAEIQRQLTSTLVLDVRYVGSKATKLYAGLPLNEVHIMDNGLLDAFNVTRAGGNAPLFDKMLLGLNFPGFGVVNGTTLTGSAALRSNSTTRTQLANGSLGAFADFLNRNPLITGVPGGLLRNGGLPENFIVPDPQFATVEIGTNPANSTYHALQVQVMKRLSHGFSNQFSYEFGKELGDADADGIKNVATRYLDPSEPSRQQTAVGYPSYT